MRNILDFPRLFQPPAAVVALEQNYRSTQPILDAANAVIAGPASAPKELCSTRGVAAAAVARHGRDETGQVDYVVERVLEQPRGGVPLRQQAVLFRAAHHSDALEVELGRRSIPFVKYGGLRFLEAAHVKDVLAILRWAENPRDRVAGFRVLQLLPGIGPGTARKALAALEAAGYGLRQLARSSRRLPLPSAGRGWSQLLTALVPAAPWPVQLGQVRRSTTRCSRSSTTSPPGARATSTSSSDLAAASPSRRALPHRAGARPARGTAARPGRRILDEDYLVLSTIHSAKGQEWERCSC